MPGTMLGAGRMEKARQTQVSQEDSLHFHLPENIVNPHF